MKKLLLAGMAAAGLVVTATPALADDPKDPDMQTAEARAADAAIIRQLNIEQAQFVSERDARLAEGWRRHREFPAELARYEDELSQYEQSRAEYEARLVAWRQAVQRCREGQWDYCD